MRVQLHLGFSRLGPPTGRSRQKRANEGPRRSPDKILVYGPRVGTLGDRELVEFPTNPLMHQLPVASTHAP